MRVKVTYEWHAELRRALNQYHNLEGKATRAEIEEWMSGLLNTTIDDLMAQVSGYWDESQEGGKSMT